MLESPILQAQPRVVLKKTHTVKKFLMRAFGILFLLASFVMAPTILMLGPFAFFTFGIPFLIGVMLIAGASLLEPKTIYRSTLKFIIFLYAVLSIVSIIITIIFYTLIESYFLFLLFIGVVELAKVIIVFFVAKHDISGRGATGIAKAQKLMLITMPMGYLTAFGSFVLVFGSALLLGLKSLGFFEAGAKFWGFFLPFVSASELNRVFDLIINTIGISATIGTQVVAALLFFALVTMMFIPANLMWGILWRFYISITLDVGNAIFAWLPVILAGGGTATAVTGVGAAAGFGGSAVAIVIGIALGILTAGLMLAMFYIHKGETLSEKGKKVKEGYKQFEAGTKQAAEGVANLADTAGTIGMAAREGEYGATIGRAAAQVEMRLTSSNPVVRFIGNILFPSTGALSGIPVIAAVLGTIPIVTLNWFFWTLEHIWQNPFDEDSYGEYWGK